jgi:TRAP-type C4-dicarboxylate transport system substrate-binding protein
MLKTTFRGFARSALIASLLTLSAAAQAADIELIAATQAPGGGPFEEGLNKFAELVAEKTNGEVAVKVFVNGQLGSEPELFQGAMAGTVDVIIVSPGNIAEFIPQIAILEMPFVTSSHEQVERIIDGFPMKHLSGQLNEKTGTSIIGVFGGGTRNMFFTKPKSGLEDFKGIRFRVQASKQLSDSYGALGLEPTVLPYKEMYGALSTGIIEGGEMESIYSEAASFPEVAPHTLMTRHVVTIRPLVMSDKTLAKLSDEQRAAVLEAAMEAALFERGKEKEADTAALQRMKDKYNLTYQEIDVTPMIDAIRPVWMKYAKEWGEEKLLEEIEATRQ